MLKSAPDSSSPDRPVPVITTIALAVGCCLIMAGAILTIWTHVLAWLTTGIAAGIALVMVGNAVEQIMKSRR
jgi:hypothetical protein